MSHEEIATKVDSDERAAGRPRVARLGYHVIGLSAGLLLVAATASQQGCGGSGTQLPTGKTTLSQVQRGRQLVLSSGCSDCHAGGLDDPSSATWLAGYTGPATTPGPGVFQLGPFWVYAANLTPDVATGLGSITERQVYNALKFGLDPMATPSVVITSTTPGVGNFPAVPHYLMVMPWPSFRQKSDDDLWAIVAYVKHGLKGVSNAVVAGTEPPDFWASSLTPEKIGPNPEPSFPAAGEQFTL